jgi:acetyl-CoA C-acetyltransferase
VRVPAYVLGEGGAVTHFAYSQEPDLTRFGWAQAGRQAFAAAGITPADIDVAEIYDSYPIYQLIAFEELGLCERGEAGELFLRGDTWPGGSDPDHHRRRHAVQGPHRRRRLRFAADRGGAPAHGQGRRRQVPNARFAVETATGGTYFDAQVTVLGIVVIEALGLRRAR